MAEPMVYVYAITRDPAPGMPDGLTGIGGTLVRTVRASGLSAVVGDVDSDGFGEQGLRTNLEDLRWLERTVREHNRVVETVAARTTVAPVGLATVYHHDDRVREALTERAEDFAGVLNEITGRTEWGVKAYANPEAFGGDEPDGSEEEQRPGAAYLNRLRARRRGRAEAEEESWRLAQETHARLDGIAHASRLHPAQNRDLAGYEGVMVLNGAYLVDDARNEEFAAAVGAPDRSSAALRLELTGPWPAYSFAALAGDRG